MKYLVNLNGKEYEIEVERGEAQIIAVRDASAPEIAPVTAAPVAAPAPAPIAPPVAPPPAPVAEAAAPAPAAGGDRIVAPMPGTVVNVAITVGQAVKKGQVLVVFEAMKMENEIVAARDGVIGSVHVKKGDSIGPDDLLLTLL